MKNSEHNNQTGGSLLLRLLFGGLTLLTLAAIVLPLLQDARIPSRRSVCSSNLRQLAAAVCCYETTHNRFPGYVEVDFVQGKPYKRPGMAALLPYMERWQLHGQYQRYAGDGLDPGVSPPFFPWLDCPSNGRQEAALERRTPLSDYRWNTGVPDGRASATIPADWLANGVFHSAYPRDAAGNSIATSNSTYSWISARDGVSQTILWAEARTPYLWPEMAESRVGIVWQTSANPSVQRTKLDDPVATRDPYHAARPGGYHPNYLMVTFADCSTQCISPAIDYRVYCQLLAPDDANVRTAGINMSRLEAIRTTPLLPGEYQAVWGASRPSRDWWSSAH